MDDILTPEIVDINEASLVKSEGVDPVAIFTGNALDAVLSEIERQVSALKPDIETAKGRKEIASTAHKVSKSKVLIDNWGKGLTADWKAKAKKVDASRKKARDFLDDLKNRVRQPLTDYENAEKKRLDDLNDRLEALQSFSDFPNSNPEADSATIEKWLSDLKAIPIDDSWEEFAPEAAVLKDKGVASLEKVLETRKKYEAEQAELKRLREEAAKREQEERDRKIAEEAAARAKKEAEEKARHEREEMERREREAKEAAERAEREKVEAEERAKRAAEEAAERAEREKQEAIAAAERRAREEAERKERERIQREEAERRERERIAADKKHRQEINNAALADFEQAGIDAETAKEVIRLVATNQISYISINY